MIIMHIYIYHIITYWISCYVLNILLHNKYINNITLVQHLRTTNPPQQNKIKDAYVYSILNQLLIVPIVMWSAPYYMNNITCSYIDSITKFIFYTFIADQWFYWSHRIMHYPLFYKSIHHIHHRWTYPIPIATLYAHPLEHIICNFGSLSAGPLLLPGNENLIAVWITIATFNSVLSHSGIDIGLPVFTSQKHDLHHRILNCNYGPFGFSDRLYKTRRF